MFSELYVSGIRIKEIEEEAYYKQLPVIRNIIAMEMLEFTSRVTFLVGENGIGKSTVIEALAVAMGFNPEGGTRNFAFSTEDSHSGLYNYMTVCRGIKKPLDGFFLRAESMYNAATYLDNMKDPKATICYGGSLHHKSHGESFLSVVEHRFGGKGIYILDEPEAALSPTGLLRLLGDIKALVDNDSQFIIATHSPILMAFPGADVIQLSDKGIEHISYKDTEHYIVTKRFMDAPEKILSEVLDLDADIAD